MVGEKEIRQRSQDSRNACKREAVMQVLTKSWAEVILPRLKAC